jgi:hypothetical protein
VIDERGLGKSHLLGALHHVASDSASAESWLKVWATTLRKPEIGQIALRKGALVIGESLHRQRYKFLWDLLFEKDPHGAYIRGKWEGMGEQKIDVPSDKLILELLRHTPTVLPLDEFQTWYNGLTNTKQFPWRNWAFNFIQVLSEIAKEHPELLVLVASVRNGASDAYQQIHRVNPVAIDFKAGGTPERIRQDRRRMLLHRLFENRVQIHDEEIEKLTAKHIEEYFRLLAVSPSEHERKRNEFAECWPFAPHLLQLLEDQVLAATDAQETRDLIRILANLFKSHGEQAPLLTAGDFQLDDDATGNGAQSELRELLKRRFDRFAVLRSWSFGDPTQSGFEIEAVPNATGQIPESIEEKIANDLFVPEDFKESVLEAAAESAPLGKLLRELQEPRPGGKECVPWLGETEIKERILRLCASGKIAIRGMEFLQALAGEDEGTVWRRLRSKLPYTGRQLDEVLLLKPSAVPAMGGGEPGSPAPSPSAPSGGLFGGSPNPGSPPVAGPGSGDSAAPPADGGPSIFSEQAGAKP